MRAAAVAERAIRQSGYLDMLDEEEERVAMLIIGNLDQDGYFKMPAVEGEVDYSTRNKLPGFLSESYTGNGVQYSGAVGVPDIKVSPNPRITDAPSLYTLGPAYAIAPDRAERFLAANWPAVAGLLTDHGPWEGFNTTQRRPVRFQTSAHTLSLALGILGTGSGHMARYLEGLP